MYRTIDSRLWTDPRVKDVPALGKLVFIHLITNQHSHLGGIYYLPKFLISKETGIALHEVDTLLDTLSRVGLIRYDEKTEVVWVCNMMKYQGKGEKNQRSVAAVVSGLHESSIKDEFLDAYPEILKFMKDRVSHRVSDGYSKFGKSGTQEQEQEKEQEQNPPTPHGGGTGGDVKGGSQGTPSQQNVEVKMGFLMGLCSQRLFVGKPETYRRNIRLAAARGKPWEEIERMIRAAEPGAKVWDVLGGGGNNGEEERDVRKILERANRRAQENRA